MQDLLTDVIKTGSIILNNHTRQKLDLRLIIGSDADLSSVLMPQFYYLVNALILPVPALRHRSSDIPSLAGYMLKQLNRQYNKNCHATPEFLHALEDCSWPGNLRQMESYLKRLVVLSSGETVLSSLKEAGSPDDSGFFAHLDSQLPITSMAPPAGSAEWEPGFIIKGRKVTYYELQELDHYYQGKKGLIAEKLGVSRSTLWRYYRDMEAAGWPSK